MGVFGPPYGGWLLSGGLEAEHHFGFGGYLAVDGGDGLDAAGVAPKLEDSAFDDQLITWYDGAAEFCLFDAEEVGALSFGFSVISKHNE